ncbi:MAG: two-component system regulatory protein YycI [Candidatus Heteroscillospira sp.]|jgi:regulatory protein YycI of two-component signal transduction system YycFG
MDTAKVKNFIILVLVLVNLFLLGTYAAARRSRSELEQAAYSELSRLYADSRISLPEELDISRKAPAGLGLTRDLDAEKRIAESVLGRCSVTEQGGNIYAYSGPDGQASFRGTGEFEMLLGYGVADTSRGKVQCARELLKKMGIESGSFVSETGDGEQTTVVLDCRYEDSEVYNARVSFLFSGDNLMIVYGKRVFDTVTDTNTAETIDAGTALVRFLKESAENGHVCTDVLSISSGYVMSVAVSGDCTLSPVWHIETDTGEYTLSAETGKLETVSY